MEENEINCCFGGREGVDGKRIVERERRLKMEGQRAKFSFKQKTFKSQRLIHYDKGH